MRRPPDRSHLVSLSSCHEIHEGRPTAGPTQKVNRPAPLERSDGRCPVPPNPSLGPGAHRGGMTELACRVVMSTETCSELVKCKCPRQDSNLTGSPDTAGVITWDFGTSSRTFSTFTPTAV